MFFVLKIIGLILVALVLGVLIFRKLRDETDPYKL
jgi:hypothetical protein